MRPTVMSTVKSSVFGLNKAPISENNDPVRVVLPFGVPAGIVTYVEILPTMLLSSGWAVRTIRSSPCYGMLTWTEIFGAEERTESIRDGMCCRLDAEGDRNVLDGLDIIFCYNLELDC